MDIEKLLFERQDVKYCDFHARLVPTLDKARIIGVRMPVLRELARSLEKDGKWVSYDRALFLETLPHWHYDENMLHAIIVSREKNFEAAISYTEKFLPYIDNWAVCDCFSPKAFAKNVDLLQSYIDKWLKSEPTYTVRFGIVNAMKYLLDERFDIGILDKVCNANNDEYYVNMAVAWFLSEALVKHYDSTLEFMSAADIDVWTYNKALQKARESFRLTQEQKACLKAMKR